MSLGSVEQLVSDAIQRNNRFRVIDHVTSSSEVVSAVRKAQPDLAVISARLQDGASDGLWALQGLRALTHGKIKNPFQLASAAPPFGQRLAHRTGHRRRTVAVAACALETWKFCPTAQGSQSWPANILF